MFVFLLASMFGDFQ